MVERFTKSARRVVEGASLCAQRTGSETVTAEHLLLSLLDLADTDAADVLDALGVDRQGEVLRGALGEARRRGGVSRTDAEALAELGIDVTEIVARVEHTHGPGALATAGRRSNHRWSGGHRPFTPEAKSVLERSLRAALTRVDRHIGDEHLLLALATGPGVVADVLTENGAPPAAILRVLKDDGKRRPKAS